MSLFFSNCGSYLHIGTVEAVRMIDKKQASLVRAAKVYALSFVVTTLQLSTRKPCTERPLLVHRQVHNLGIWKKTYFPTLPYSWTWTKAHAYFCINGLTLRVYKITLPVPGCSSRVTMKDEKILTPSETVFLPYSAQDRTIQFFPPRQPGAASTVIIGPQYGTDPSPAIAVYLQSHDLGTWVDAKEKDDLLKSHGLRRRATGKFEEFDTDDDCDIIPYDAE